MAIRKRRVNLVKHRSGFEDKVILALQNSGVEFEYEAISLQYQAKIQLYTPDILLYNGIIVELKGYWDPLDRQKMLLIKEQYPDLDIRMVFQKADKPIRKGSKTTYAMFCDKNGIKWASGDTIPSEWLLEEIKEIGHVEGIKRKASRQKKVTQEKSSEVQSVARKAASLKSRLK